MPSKGSPLMHSTSSAVLTCLTNKTTFILLNFSFNIVKERNQPPDISAYNIGDVSPIISFGNLILTGSLNWLLLRTASMSSRVADNRFGATSWLRCLFLYIYILAGLTIIQSSLPASEISTLLHNSRRTIGLSFFYSPAMILCPNYSWLL